MGSVLDRVGKEKRKQRKKETATQGGGYQSCHELARGQSTATFFSGDQAKRPQVELVTLSQKNIYLYIYLTYLFSIFIYCCLLQGEGVGQLW